MFYAEVRYGSGNYMEHARIAGVKDAKTPPAAAAKVNEQLSARDGVWAWDDDGILWFIPLCRIQTIVIREVKNAG